MNSELGTSEEGQGAISAPQWPLGPSDSHRKDCWSPPPPFFPFFSSLSLSLFFSFPLSLPLSSSWHGTVPNRVWRHRTVPNQTYGRPARVPVPNVTDVGLRPRLIKRVAVIGGGLMGSGIATALILNNISVILKEINSKFLQKGLKMIEANVEGLVKKGSLTQDKMNKALSLLKGVLDYSEFKNVDMVIEAVIENVSLKQSIFADIEKFCPPTCIFATNTSTIDLNIVGEKTHSQDRILGAHFFRS